MVCAVKEQVQSAGCFKNHIVLQKASLYINFSALLALKRITCNRISQYTGMSEKEIQYNSFHPHSMIEIWSHPATQVNRHLTALSCNPSQDAYLYSLCVALLVRVD